MVLKHSEDVTTFHRVEVDDCVVEAFGDGEMGSYDYRVIDSLGDVIEQSNLGFGQVGVALTYGLCWVMSKSRPGKFQC